MVSRRRTIIALATAWAAYFASVIGLAALGSPLAGPLSAMLFPLLVVTGYILPWKVSLILLVLVTAALTLAGPDSVNIHIALGAAPLPAGASFGIVGAVLLGLGAAAQLAIHAAKRAGREEGARIAAQQEMDRLRLVLKAASHEIANALTTLNMSAWQAREHLHDEAHAVKLEQTSRRIRRLVGDLSDAAKAMEGDLIVWPKRRDVAKLVREIALDFDASLRSKEIVLSIDAPEEILANVDEARVEQCVANLFQNAVRYTPEGGTVRVRVTEDPEHILIAVEDTGLGLTREQIHGLFQPFARFHADVAEGSGLGLWVVAKIMKAHHGSIDAASPGPGQGATFTLRFPAARSAGRAG